MKTKAKLTLAISVLSAAVLAAGVTSTFAWFTIDRTADVTYGDLKVDTISTITLQSYKIGYDATVGADGNNSNHLSAPGERLGAVSSTDGKVFSAPKVLGTNTANQDFDVITTKADWETTKNYKNKNVGYVKYAITISATPEEDPHSLYWNINPGVSGAGIADQWRIAMYESTTAGATANVRGVSSVVYGSTAASAQTNYAVAIDTTKPTEAVGKAVQAVTDIKDEDDGFGSAFGKNQKLVNNFTGLDAPTLTVTIAIWLEGYGNENNTASGQKLAPVITFSLE